MDFFNHQKYVDDLANELGLTYDDILRFQSNHSDYANQVYAIPITVWTPPEPYKQPRYNRFTKSIYVPEKQKMVGHIRDLIMEELGPEYFLNGFFPRYTETILKSALYIPTPKSFSKEAKYLAECKRLRPIVTPDTDNVEKIINDAIKSFIVYDDAQIVSDITEKFYSTKPRMEFTIYYNASPMSTVHEKMIQQRKERWQAQIQQDTAVIQYHLKRYFRKHKNAIKNGQMVMTEFSHS